MATVGEARVAGPAPSSMPDVGSLRPARRPSSGARGGRSSCRRDRCPVHEWRLGQAGGMSVQVVESLEGIDWTVAKAQLAADDFDNGRSPGALRASFERSGHVAVAWDGEQLVGMARLLSDGVCNAYLVDVWTASSHRRQGVGSALVRRL